MVCLDGEFDFLDYAEYRARNNPDRLILAARRAEGLIRRNERRLDRGGF